MSVDGHIFRMNFLQNISKKLQYDNIGHYEAFLSLNAPKVEMPHMCCFEKSPIFNIPLNTVSPFKNINMNITTHELNNRYLKGDEIDIDKYKGFNNISPHQEVELFWKQK
jgi:hypothetical protein